MEIYILELARLPPVSPKASYARVKFWGPEDSLAASRRQHGLPNSGQMGNRGVWCPLLPHLSGNSQNSSL